MSKKKPAGRVWADGDGDEFLVRVPHEAPTTRSAALVATPGDVVYLTAAQCREVAAHLTALADAHEHDDGPMSAADYADQEDTRP